MRQWEPKCGDGNSYSNGFYKRQKCKQELNGSEDKEKIANGKEKKFHQHA